MVQCWMCGTTVTSAKYEITSPQSRQATTTPGSISKSVGNNPIPYPESNLSCPGPQRQSTEKHCDCVRLVRSCWRILSVRRNWIAANIEELDDRRSTVTDCLVVSSCLIGDSLAARRVHCLEQRSSRILLCITPQSCRPPCRAIFKLPRCLPADFRFPSQEPRAVRGAHRQRRREGGALRPAHQPRRGGQRERLLGGGLGNQQAEGGVRHFQDDARQVSGGNKAFDPSTIKIVHVCVFLPRSMFDR